MAYFGIIALYESTIGKCLRIGRKTRVPSGEKMVVRPGDLFRENLVQMVTITDCRISWPALSSVIIILE